MNAKLQIATFYNHPSGNQDVFYPVMMDIPNDRQLFNEIMLAVTKTIKDYYEVEDEE